MYKLFSVIVSFSDLDANKYEVKNLASAILSESSVAEGDNDLEGSTHRMVSSDNSNSIEYNE